MLRRLTAIAGIVLCCALVHQLTLATIPRDHTADNRVDTSDALQSLQTVAGLRDGTAVLNDAIYALRVAAGLKPSAGYTGTETSFQLIRGGANQFLLPVEIGNQVFNLLVDTGSNALLLFEDKLDAGNRSILSISPAPITITDQAVSKSYASTVRSGVLAHAPVRIGSYTARNMRIMLIREPDSQNDPSLTAKGADGVIGLRRTEGLTLNLDPVPLDVPLGVLEPAVNIFELNLPQSGPATLAFGQMPIIDHAQRDYIFKAKTHSVIDPADPAGASYSDLQVPFRAKSSFGEAVEAELDVLLDTGAVSTLVLDTEVAKSLGYDPFTDSWSIPEDEVIEFNLIGPKETILLNPKFRVSEIRVAPYSQMGVKFEAVLGISRWQSYVVGFSSVPYTDGGPDGTISMLHRPDINESLARYANSVYTHRYTQLDALNSSGDDRNPAVDYTGETVVFQSNRAGGPGGWDIYVWRAGIGLMELPGLNSAQDEADPEISTNGRYVLFHSNREGGQGDQDIYLYDLETSQFVALPGLNSPYSDRQPACSKSKQLEGGAWDIDPDGRYIVFASKRPDSLGDFDLYRYDRDTGQLEHLPNTYNSVNPEVAPTISSMDDIYFTRESGNAATGLNRDVVGSTEDFAPLWNTAHHESAPALLGGNLFRLALETNRRNPHAGLDDRDIVVWKEGLASTLQPGLNSPADDGGPALSGNGEQLAFHSLRSGGQGGYDIYLYNLSETLDLVDIPNPEPGRQVETLELTATANRHLLLPVTVGSYTGPLFIEPGLSGLILFDDVVAAGGITDTAEPVTWTLPDGNTLSGTIGRADFAIAGYQVEQLDVVLIPRQAFAAWIGHPVEDAAGILGLSYTALQEFDIEIGQPLMALQPFISKLELDPAPQGSPGLSLGAMPLIDNAPADGINFCYWKKTGAELSGYADVTAYPNPTPDNPTAESGIFILSTILPGNQVVLDQALAIALGYDAAQAHWGSTTAIDITLLVNLYNQFFLGRQIPIGNIAVVDFAESYDADIIIGRDYWENFVIGLDRNPDIKNEYGLTFFLTQQDAWQVTPGGHPGDDHHFADLADLNSFADEFNGDISDDGQSIVFQSNRNGDWNIFYYRIGTGYVELPGLNSTADDLWPSINADGSLVAFHTIRNGSRDVLLYDVNTQTLIDPPGLNSEHDEFEADLSADGTRITFNFAEKIDIDYYGQPDIRLYSIPDQALLFLPSGWLNTDGWEEEPTVNADAGLIGFTGSFRPDSDLYIEELEVTESRIRLWNVDRGQLEEIPAMGGMAPTSVFTWPPLAGMPNLSADGKYVGFHSNISRPDLFHRTNDIFVLERDAQEFMYLPGINSHCDDSGAALSSKARQILFHSSRPGGKGGYDLYLYQRDEGDPGQYTVATTFQQQGTVLDAAGNPAAETPVIAVDAAGNTLAETTSDFDGTFQVTIAAGAPLPVTYTTSDETLRVVVDEVGDDTYVPSFQLGNLKFTDVWVEDTARAGMPSTIHFNVETDVPKYNTYVKVYLKRLEGGNASDLDITDINFDVDYTLTAMLIEKLGHRGTENSPVVNRDPARDDLVTTITYTPDTGNRKAYVEQTFTVPASIADGTYAAIFSVDRFDYNPGDDALQGEESVTSTDNFMVAPASIIIGQPDKPNLRVLYASLLSAGFELPDETPDLTTVKGDPALILDLEVESMARDTTDPVNITFELDVDGSRYPLYFATQDENGNAITQATRTYSPVCRPEEREGFPTGDRCAALFRQEQVGFTYELYLNPDGYTALADKTTDATCQLIVTVDPAGNIQEWEDNKTDNVQQLAVQFLAPQTGPTTLSATLATKYPKAVIDAKTRKKYGNAKFAVGYEFGPEMSYRMDTIDGTELPTAANFDAYNEVWSRIFGKKWTIIGAGLIFDFDVDNLTGSTADANITVLNQRIWSPGQSNRFEVEGCDTKCAACKNKCPAGDSTCLKRCETAKEKELWNTKDKNGNEMVSKEKKVKFSFNFMAGPIPITVSAGLIGEIGLRGSLGVEAGNKLVLAAGPYAGLDGFLEGGLGVAIFSVGIGVELTLIDVYLKLSPSIQILPSYPLGIIRFEAPLVISTLDGYVYVYFRAIFVEHKISIIDWKGLSWKFQTFPPLAYGFGAIDEYKAWFNGNPAGQNTGLIYYNWGTGAPPGAPADNFEARWEGFFEFGGYDYTCDGGSGCSYGNTYDLMIDHDTGSTMIIKVDMNDDGEFWGDEIVYDSTTQYAVRGSIQPSIERGIHQIQVIYTETTGDARATLWWKIQGEEEFVALYYNNTTLTGDPVYFSREKQIDHDWGATSPKLSSSKQEIVNKDNFSVRWEGSFTFPLDADYGFIAIADDGVRVYVDNQLVIDQWNGSGKKVYTTSRTFSKGSHQVKVEYVEKTGSATAQVFWQPLNTFYARYEKKNTNGTITKTYASEAGINPKIHPDDFDTARWDGVLNFWTDLGTWRNMLTTNGATSVFIDGEKVFTTRDSISRLTGYQIETSAQSGLHHVRVDYARSHAGIRPLVYMGTAIQQQGQSWRKEAYYYNQADFEQQDPPVPPAFTRFYETSTQSRAIDLFLNHGESPSAIDEGYQSSSPLHLLTRTNHDGFAVRTEASELFEAAPYIFELAVDGAIRVWVDAVKVVDEWYPHTGYRHFILPMNKGYHRIKVEYVEDSGKAVAVLKWKKAAKNVFYPTYYEGFLQEGFYFSQCLQGAVAFDWYAKWPTTNPEAVTEINNSWGTGGLKYWNCVRGDWYNRTDSFSIRYIGLFDFDEAQYRFAGKADDEMMLFIGGRQQMKGYQPNCLVSKEMPRGEHVVEVVYHEKTGNAAIEFGWSKEPEKGIAFAGQGYIAIPHQAAHVPPTALTMEAWVRPEDNGQTYQNILLKGAYGYGLLLKRMSAQTAQLYYWNTGSHHEAFALGTLKFGQWSHLAVTVTTTPEKRVTAYINGHETASLTHPALVIGHGDNHPLYIGRQGQGCTCNYFKGKMDEIRIWSTARSLADIQKTMGQKLTGQENNLVVYLDFNQTGGNVAELVAGRKDNPVANAVYTVSDALSAQDKNYPMALRFDGSDDYVVGTDLDLSGDFTIETWFRVPDADDGQHKPIVSKQAGAAATNNDAELYLSVHANGMLSCFMSSDETPYDVNLTGSTLEDNTWHHAALVMAGTRATLYLNGEPVGSDTFEGTRRNGVLPLNIGRYSAGTTHHFFKGSLNDLRVWNVARTVAEIRSGMKADVAKFSSQHVPGLLANYTMNQAFGCPVLLDQSYTALNHGIVAGCPDLVAEHYENFTFADLAMAMDGVDDYLTVPHQPSQVPTGALTMEAWVHPTHYGNRFANILVKGEANHGYGLLLDSEGSRDNTKIYYWNSGTTYNTFPIGNIKMGQWSHLAVVVTTTPTRSITTYVNGVQVYTITDSRVTIGHGDNLPLYIGRQGASCPCNYFNGKMDDLRLWSTARTQAEIQAGMTNTFADGKPGLIADFQFNALGSAKDSVTGTPAGVNGNPGWTETGSKVSAPVAPVPDLAFALDGVDDFITIPHRPSQAMTTAVTLEAWVNPAAQSSYYTNILLKGNYGYGLLLHGGDRDGPSTITYWNGGEYKKYVVGQVPKNQWSHVAVVVTTSPTKSIVSYINGIESKRHGAADIVIDNGGNGELYIGRQGSGCPCNYYKGLLNDVRVWNVARTKAQIQTAMSQRLTGTESGLAAHVNFDAQGTVSDAVGGAAGTLYGAPAPGWAPVAGAQTPVTPDLAIVADGADDVVSIPSDSLRPAKDFTIEAWVKIEDPTLAIIYMHNEDGGGDDGYLLQVQNGKATFGAMNSNGWAKQTVTSQISLLKGRWYHIACVYDAAYKLSMYIDGQLQATKQAAGDVHYAKTDFLYLFCRQGSSLHSQVTLDELRFWNTSRSQNDILSNMAKRLAGNETGLAAYFSFDVAGVVKDHSGAIEATTAGDPQWVEAVH